MRLLKLVWAFAALGASGLALAGLPGWLDGPTGRVNPNDPKSQVRWPAFPTPVPPSATPSATPGASSSATPSPSASGSFTQSPTQTPSLTQSCTESPSPTVSETATQTRSNSPTPSATKTFTQTPGPVLFEDFDTGYPLNLTFSAGGGDSYLGASRTSAAFTSPPYALQVSGTASGGPSGFSVGSNYYLPQGILDASGTLTLRFQARSSGCVSFRAWFKEGSLAENNGNNESWISPPVYLNPGAAWTDMRMDLAGFVEDMTDPLCAGFCQVTGNNTMDLRSVKRFGLKFDDHQCGGPLVLEVDDVIFDTLPAPTPAPPPANGSFPMITGFAGNKTRNNFPGDTVLFTDASSNCGTPSSWACLSERPSGGHDGGPYENFNYVHALNTGCGYDYCVITFYSDAYLTDLSAYTGLRLRVRGALGGEPLMLWLESDSDPCNGNFPNYASAPVTVSSAWAQQDIPFSAFTDWVGGCPFQPWGLANIISVQISIDVPTAGSVDLDDFELY